MSKKSARTPKPSAPPRAAHAATGSPSTDDAGLFLSRWGLIVSCGLLFGRLLLPVESAAGGDTALLVLPWCLLLAAVSWLAFRRRLNATWFRIDLADAGLLVTFTGMVLSCGAIWLSGGQLRAALNMTWEWLGILLAVLITRRFWGMSRSPLPLAVLIGLGTALAGQGIYQYAVQLPEQRAGVIELVEEYQEAEQQLEANGGEQSVNSRVAARAQRLEQQLYENGIPTDPRALRMFLERLNSSEPFAQFALANTLAGILAVCLILLLGLGLRMLRDAEQIPSTGWLVLAIALALTLYCLTLTKSRTAWAAAALGILLLGGCLPSGPAVRKRLLVAVGGLLALLVLGIGGALATGALDLEVISEANKSLQYRFEYWTASWSMLQDNWLFGVGPGNFRQNYLAWKLPYSSEEILDPHNIWFDAWASGGLLALGGLVLTLYAILRMLTRLFLQSDGTTTIGGHSAEGSFTGALAAVGLAGLFAFLLPSPEIAPLLETILLLVLGAAVVAALVMLEFDRVGLSLYPVAVAAVTLFIHLNGAGGYSMPGIIAVFFLLGLGPKSMEGSASETSDKRAGIVAPVTLGLAGCFLLAGWILVIDGELAAWSAAGRLSRANSSRAAQVALLEWAEQDPVNPEPYVQLGGMYQSLADSEQGSSTTRYAEAAIDAYEKAAVLDPRNHHTFRELAAVHAQLAETGQAEHWDQAVKSQQEAIKRYPGTADLRAGLAEYLVQAGQLEAAFVAARKALEIDQLNRDAGHVDRLLPDELRQRLEKLKERREIPNTGASET